MIRSKSARHPNTLSGFPVVRKAGKYIVQNQPGQMRCFWPVAPTVNHLCDRFDRRFPAAEVGIQIPSENEWQTDITHFFDGRNNRFRLLVSQ